MFLKDCIEEGSYAPAFFQIKLNTNLNPFDAINDKYRWHIFGHEYIHFLQDILLPYPIRNNKVFLFLLSNIIREITENKKIEIPYQLTSIENENMEVMNRTFGEMCSINHVSRIYLHDKKGVFEIKDCGPLHKKAKVYEYIVIIEKKDSNDKEIYTLGARDLLEYIANKIISKQLGETQNVPDFPYKTVDFLLNYLGLSDLPDEVRILLAEYALYNDNPIHHFFWIIDNIIKKDRLILNSNNKVKEFLDNIIIYSSGGICETYVEKRERRLLDFQEYLIGFYDPKGQLSIQNWIKHISDYVHQNLLDDFYFSKLFSLSYNEFCNELDKLYNTLGTPLVFNNKNEYGMNTGMQIITQDQLNEFFVFVSSMSFLNFISGKKLECPMKRICINNPGMISDKCNIIDFKNANNNELCPFYLFIRRYKLNNVVIKIKNAL